MPEKITFNVIEKNKYENINDITKKIIPKAKVKRLINNSNPLSLACWNKESAPPVIIWPASEALLLCNNTIAINNTETTNKTVSNILSTSIRFIIYHNFFPHKSPIKSIT